MPGGGPWRTGAGQITDDGELAMCLMHGLVAGNKGRSKDEEKVLST